MAPLLQLFLLGPPVTHYGEVPLSIPRRQVRALLYRLAVDPLPLSRSYLACFYWGDLPECTARRNLSRLLAYLARTLPHPGILRVEESAIQLEPSQIWVDTRVFQQRYESWKLTGRLSDLQAAVQLYRGTFLDGFTLAGNSEFSAWICLEGERWEQRYLKSLECLAEEFAARGELEQAIEYARQYLLVNDLAETIHCRLIELYAALGDQRAALHQYEQCSTILERELGVHPAPETSAAYRAVLNTKPARADRAPEQPAWTTRPGLKIPFVGRQGVLQQLDQALARARAGNGSVVLLCGEAGIGKSRLIREFAACQHLRLRVGHGAASPESQNLPYQPLVEALRPLLAEPGSLDRIPEVWLAEAARLLPEFAGRVQLPQPLPSSAIGEARARLFEAFSRIVFSFAEDGYTLLLCLDDLQWADSTTLDWIAYLGRRLKGQHVLVLGCYRIEDRDTLADVCQVLAHLTEFSELLIPGLDAEEVRQLVSYLDCAMPVNKELADRLHRATGGNPFFLLEILRACLETSPPPDLQASGEVIPLPDTICQAVTSRLEKIHPRSRQVLEAGAVLGLTFDFDSILLTAGKGEIETLDGLDELVARQFLIEATSGYQFCHAILREAVYARLGIWRRRRLHRRAGEALEKIQPAAYSALAWHFEQAGEAGKAASYLLKAGQAARAIFAHQEARACFDRTLSLLENAAKATQDIQAVETNRRLRIQALYERGWALRLLGEMSAYTDDLQEVTKLAQALGDPRAMAHLHWQEAYNHRWYCRYEPAMHSAEHGKDFAQQASDAFLEAVCLREIGMAARETGDFSPARLNLEQALEIFTGLQETVYSIHTLGNLSTLFYRCQDANQAFLLARRALDICERSGLQFERRLPLGDLGVAVSALGDFHQGCSLLEESLSIANQIADQTQEIFCEGHLGKIFAQVGQFSKAEQHLMAALSLSEEIVSLTEQSWLHAGLAETYAGLGKHHHMVEHAETALRIARDLKRSHDVRQAEQLLARFAPEAGI